MVLLHVEYQSSEIDYITVELKTELKDDNDLIRPKF